jgi:hypothetical protein
MERRGFSQAAGLGATGPQVELPVIPLHPVVQVSGRAVLSTRKACPEHGRAAASDNRTQAIALVHQRGLLAPDARVPSPRRHLSAPPSP